MHGDGLAQSGSLTGGHFTRLGRALRVVALNDFAFDVLKFKRPAFEGPEIRPLHVQGVQASFALGLLILHALSLFQRAIAFGLDAGEMDKHILSLIVLDETVPFSSIEPPDCTH